MTEPPQDGATARPRVIWCVEHEEVEVDMSWLVVDGRVQMSEEIAKGDYFAVSMSRGGLTLKARGYVGLIPVNDQLSIAVSPRVPVLKLAHLGELAEHPPEQLAALRNYALGGEPSADAFDHYAGALLAHLELIEGAGLLRRYSRRESTSSQPRGRVLASPTIRRHWARNRLDLVVTSYFQRSADIPPNQALKLAVWTVVERLRQRPSTAERRALIRRLNGLYRIFDDVSLHRGDQHRLADPLRNGALQLPSNRAYYVAPMALAGAILSGRAPDFDSVTGSLERLPALVLNMNRLFEALVRRSLQRAAAEQDWSEQVLDGNVEGKSYLYGDQPVSNNQAVTPDVVIRDATGETALVLEVKNVPVADSGRSPRDHVEQAVTYAVAYGLDQVVLVHPRAADQPGGLHYLGSVGGVRVLQYRLDLAAAAMSVELADMARTMRGLMLCGRLTRAGAPGQEPAA